RIVGPCSAAGKVYGAAHDRWPFARADRRGCKARAADARGAVDGQQSMPADVCARRLQRRRVLLLSPRAALQRRKAAMAIASARIIHAEVPGTDQGNGGGQLEKIAGGGG